MTGSGGQSGTAGGLRGGSERSRAATVIAEGTLRREGVQGGSSCVGRCPAISTE